MRQEEPHALGLGVVCWGLLKVVMDIELDLH